MAGKIPRAFIDDLIARHDIVDVIDARVKLKKAGKNFSACCPFHNEKPLHFPLAKRNSSTTVLAVVCTATYWISLWNSIDWNLSMQLKSYLLN